MNAPSEIRAQLATLRIPKDQRPESSPTGPRRKGGTKWLVVSLLILVAGAGAYFGRRQLGQVISGTAEAAEVRLMKVSLRQESEAPPVLTATGKIVSDHKVQVTTKVSGQIVALSFEQGDRVQKGQLLARIEDVIYRARRDESAARLEKAKASLAFAKFNFDRTADLFKRDTAPKIEYAETERAVREGEAELAAAQAVLDYTQKALNDCEVVAPIAGVILERNVEVGDFVAVEGGRGANANAQFALIADMTKLRVEVDVSELDIARLKTGMPCTVTPDAYKDRRYQGRVMWLDPGANYSKATVQVKVRIENPDEYLRVEGSAQVIFQAGPPASAPSASRNAPAIWIPASACTLDALGTSGKVFILAEGRLKATTVTIGRRNGGQVEVIEGLSEGQSIAIEGLDKLTDGQRVRS